MLSTLPASYHALIDDFLANTGMTPGMAHINAGLAIYLAGQFLFRDRRSSTNALKLVIAATAFNELMDFLYGINWTLNDTLGDVLLTLCWPVAMMAMSQYRRRRFAIRAARLQRMIADNPLTAFTPSPA